MTTNQPAPITPEQMTIAVQGFAQGDKISAIAERTGLSAYRVRGLLKKKEIADAIDRMRLTDTIPTQLSAIMGMMSALSKWLENADSRLCAIEEEVRKVRTAMHRLQVENKGLRETRRDARKQLREAKAALWKARGY
ncbi:hypothetical protein [Sphingobium sp. UBA5915]|uniref:hypothetical protein n=1 Tax=Sphingobium sp. UBA5915 TaxID=1947530 RepID=UPI0025FE949C|nr:hypothetical protein [Sphingobium sp. UBA5915]